MIRYTLPGSWIYYRPIDLINELTEAKAAIISLRTMPFQRRWVDELQTVQLKREVAGTSRIEGADFTERELEAALKESAEELVTRSQKQAHAVANAYRYIRDIPDVQPITRELICKIHAIVVRGADDDHCPPGIIRKQDENVLFGAPRHRGADGGFECDKAFNAFVEAAAREFRGHDPVIQALALHYHFAAMHPFLDGNGRTARVLEALMLQRAGLKDTLFIAMSNYYYDEKKGYLESLSAVRAANHDLTPFLVFGLRGIAMQCNRLCKEIKVQVSKSIYRNLMYELFNRLKTPRKRVIANRQVEILKLLLDEEEMSLDELQRKTADRYDGLSNPRKALIRDLNGLIHLQAIGCKELEKGRRYLLFIRLEWPTRITETKFFEEVQQFPTAKDGVLCQKSALDEEKLDEDTPEPAVSI